MVEEKRNKEKRQPVHYVDNKQFYNDLVEYFTQCEKNEKEGKAIPRIPDNIGLSFMRIADGLSHIPKFFPYQFKDEMKADAIENCIRYIRNFDPQKYDNPFAYFTQICYYAFIRRIEKEKKMFYIKLKSAEMNATLDNHDDFEDESDNIIQYKMYDNLAEFCKKFEDSREAKKLKIQQKKKQKGIEQFV